MAELDVRRRVVRGTASSRFDILDGPDHLDTLPKPDGLHRLIDEEGGKLIRERDSAERLDEEELSLRVDLEEHGLVLVGQLHVEDPHDQSELTERRAQALLEVAVERVGTEGHVQVIPPVEVLGFDEGGIAALANDGDAQMALSRDALLVDFRCQREDVVAVEQLLADHRRPRQIDSTRRRNGLDDRAGMLRAEAADSRGILTDQRGRDAEAGARWSVRIPRESAASARSIPARSSSPSRRRVESIWRGRRWSARSCSTATTSSR